MKETVVDQGVLNAGISGHWFVHCCLILLNLEADTIRRAGVYLIYLKHYFAETVAYSGHC